MAVASAANGTLVYCSEGSPSGFNPELYTDSTTFDATHPIYDKLVEFKLGTTKIEPALAKSWTVSKNGLVYTFHLRHGVKFQTTPWFKPTRDFDADDVVFSFDRQWKKNNPYYKVNGGTYNYFQSMGFSKLLKSITKVNKYTVRFTLNKPNAAFLADMAMNFSAILSKQYADQLLKSGHPDQMNLKPVGTGPFQLLHYQKDAVIRYKRNPDYWGNKPSLANLIYVITPDASVRLEKLKAGECQVMVYPNPSDIASLKKNPQITMKSQPGLNIGYLAFNTEKKPFNKVKVRQALAYAVNKKAIINAIFHGHAQVASNPIPPTMLGYNKNVTGYKYDPAKAKKLLKEAGYPNGFSTDIWAMPVARPYNPNARRMAEMVQADWAKVGVKAKIVTYEWGEYLKRTAQGDHQTAFMGWTGDNGDPDNFLYTLLACPGVHTGNNIARWCNKKYTKLVTEAQQTTDNAKRAKLYQQAIKVFKQQAPWITIDHSTVFVPMRKEVHGYVMDPLGEHYFREVSIQK
ncbi:ABC transporter substrate-binding protein [Salinisphaera sp. RV14]|uniref:ABC transporter substrate-binding protein n=1 Tax=unclassified Salinisphaera TaxID=2649847 RepID=UPI003F827EA1